MPDLNLPGTTTDPVGVPVPTGVAFADVSVDAFVSASDVAALALCVGSSCMNSIDDSDPNNNAHETHLSNTKTLSDRERPSHLIHRFSLALLELLLPSLLALFSRLA